MANPSGNHQEASHATSSFNAAVNGTSDVLASAPESSGASSAMKHNPDISMDWTAEEQSILEDGLATLVPGLFLLFNFLLFNGESLRSTTT